MELKIGDPVEEVFNHDLGIIKSIGTVAGRTVYFVKLCCNKDEQAFYANELKKI